MRHYLLATAVAASLCLSPVRAEDARPPLPYGAVVHQMGADEDIAAIARLYGVPASALQSANPDASWTEGESLIIPRPDHPWPSHTVRSGETLWRIGKAYGISVGEIQQANSMSDNTLLPGMVLNLPRAVKPEWTLPDPVPDPVLQPAAATAVASSETYGSAAPRPTFKPAPDLTGNWVEVRLPDNRRAWAPVGSLVVGSWQPQSADRVIQVGRSFMGVPYKWGGVDPNGWDCSGFVQEVFRLGGHQVPRLADAQYEACTKVQLDSLQPGDMVFFNTDGSGVSHVGIYTGNDHFLHASSSRGVVEDSLKDSYFSARYYGAGRLPVWEGTSPEGVSAQQQAETEEQPAETEEQPALQQ